MNKVFLQCSLTLKKEFHKRFNQFSLRKTICICIKLAERFLVLIFIFTLITTTLAAIYDQFYLIKKHSNQ